MNKKIITLAFACAIPFALAGKPVLAQTPEPAAPATDSGEKPWHHGEKLERMAKELNLTPDQKSKVEAIFKSMHEKFKALHEETHQQIAGILTPDQMTKFDAMKQQRHHGKWQKRQQTEGTPANPPAQ